MKLEDDPQIPGSTRGREALLAFVSGAVSIGLLASVAHWVRAPFVFPSLGPTAFLLFYRPRAAASSPRNTIVGHSIGVACGVAPVLLFGLADEPDAIAAGVTWPRVAAAALSLGGTAGLMILLDTAHPPAGATTLIVSLGLLIEPIQLAVLMAAIGLLVLQAMITHALAGTPYPRWAPRPDRHASRSP